MLQGINRLGRSWVGRVVVAVMFGFLIVSFAIWGIGDIFRGGVRSQVATVAGQDVRAETFRTAYQTEYQGLIRRLRQSITPEQARAFGLEQRVLSRLVTDAALDVEARRLGLGVSDALVVRSVQADPSFRGVTGSFDRTLFNELLRQNGFSEAQYVAEQRSALARQQLAEAVTGAMPVPIALREAVHRYGAERRSAEYLTLRAAILGEIAAPTEAQITAFYGDRKGAYRAPEYRALNLLLVDAASLARPDDVSEKDARDYYEKVKGSRYGRPERRTIQQIVFPNAEEAAAASRRVKEGTAFEALAGERGIADAALTLGTFAKAEMFDPATAEAAFALPEGQVSEPVAGRFGPVLARVTKIEAGDTKGFEEVAAEAKRDVALERARDRIISVHDAIEDQRAAAKPLSEIAKERGLALVTVAAVDRSGRDKADALVPGVPEREPILAAAFRSDVGADNEAIRTREGGYVWFEVRSVEPSRERALDEIRDRVVQDWRKAEIVRGLTDKAAVLAGRLDAGETMAAVAAELGLPASTASDISRTGGGGDIAPSTAPRIFATPVGKAGSAAVGEDARLLFKVTGATVPPFVTTTREAGAQEGQLRTVLADDVFSEFTTEIERTVGVKTYPENIRRAIGGAD